MIVDRTTLLAGFAGLFLAGSITSAQAGANWIEARYEFYGFAGMHLLTNRTKVEETSKDYVIAADLDTRSLARVFVDLTSHSDVHGEFERDIPRPQAYRSDVRRNGVDHHYQVDFRADGGVIDVSTRPYPAIERQIHGTVDQLTAYFLLERQVSKRGSCALQVRVFDGSGLYNLHFTDLSQANLSSDGRQNLVGPSQLCEVVREELASSPGGIGTYQRGKIWYARVVPGGHMMPVRMEYDTDFGTVQGYLAEVRAPGIDLRLMRE